MKVISLELSKRLNEKGLLESVETEYIYYDDTGMDWDVYKNEEKFWKTLPYKGPEQGPIKTLTLEEAIELLPSEINIGGRYACLKIEKAKGFYKILYKPILKTRNEFYKTLLEAIEKMLTYLLDNNLLGK